jgi:hypothetical protein
VFQQAIREQQGSLPTDVRRFTDNDVGKHLDAVMDHFEKACIDLAPKVSQAGSTVRMFADGGGPGGRIQSELSVLNANGALVGRTSSGPAGTSREVHGSNNTPAWSGRDVGNDANGNEASSPAAGSGDTLSPVLRAPTAMTRHDGGPFNVGASRGSLPPLDGSELLPKKFDTSGKSPVYLHHRKNFEARAGKSAAGFFAGSRESCSSSPTSAAVTRS